MSVRPVEGSQPVHSVAKDEQPLAKKIDELRVQLLVLEIRHYNEFIADLESIKPYSAKLVSSPDDIEPASNEAIASSARILAEKRIAEIHQTYHEQKAVLKKQIAQETS